MKLRVLSAADLRQALPMKEAVEGMKVAFAQLSQQQAIVPLRARVEVARRNGVSLIMPAYLTETDDLGVKVVSVFPQNAERDEPIIYAMVLVLDAQNGRPLAMMEGGTLTAIRTGAGSGAATDLLARSDSRVVAILGSGVQARTQLEAVCTVRSIEEVRVYSPNQAHAAAFVEAMAGQGPIPSQIRSVSDPNTAVQDADIICAATTSSTPVFEHAALKPGAHINGVGSYLPTMQEIDAATVQQALVVVDSREAVLAEAGDLLIPISQGIIDPSHIYAELGEIAAGLKPGRTSETQITFFKSVGVAVQDAISGRIALQIAEAQDLGQLVTL